jgi:hypothetical protein
MLTIAHRFGLALLASLVLAAPAGAAEVARIDGWSLDARDDARSSLCLRLEAADGEHAGGSHGTCGRAPWRPGRSDLIARVSGSELIVAGAVPLGVASSWP